jgi:hypothetical protein
MNCSVSNVDEAGIDGDVGDVGDVDDVGLAGLIWLDRGCECNGWWLLLRATAVCNRAMGDAVVAPIAMDGCIGCLTRLKALLVLELVFLLVLVRVFIQDNGLNSWYFFRRVGAMLVGAWVLY